MATHTVTTDTIRRWAQELIAASTTFAKMNDATKVQDIAYRMEHIARIADGAPIETIRDASNRYIDPRD